MKKEGKQMCYGKILGALKELGWVEDFFWNNRTIYRLKQDKKKNYMVFEHDFCMGIHESKKDNDFRLFYCNMSYNEFVLYTSLVKSIIDAENNQNNISLEEYNKRVNAYKRFAMKLKRRSNFMSYEKR